tara:strand:+ start:548 stop:733 length:186 start_codon:yes stop_codon:yes gene_type:complete
MFLGIPRVLAQRELEIRAGRSRLTEERVYNLVYDITEDENRAQKEVAQFIIEESKRKSRYE